MKSVARASDTGKGQAAFEYMILLSIALLLITPMIIFSLNTTATQRTVNDGEVAMARIAGAAESVYAQGIGAKQTVTVYIPEASNLAASSVSGRLVILKVFSEGTQYDIVRIFPFNVTGSLPLTPGYQEVAIETLPSGIVRIGTSSGAVCGNGVRETGEDCDGSDLGGASCLSLGYITGTLTCTATCTYNTSACLLGSIFYVNSYTSGNGTVTNFNAAKNASDGNAAAVFTEATYGGASQTLTLNASEVVSAGTWTLTSNTFESEDLRATTTDYNNLFEVGLQNTTATGTINSIVGRVEQTIIGNSGDQFDTRVRIGTGAANNVCNDVVGSSFPTETYLNCNFTSNRPGGGSWSFNDLNDTRIQVMSERAGALPTSWNVDHVQLAINYTSPSTYTLNVTTDFTGVTLGGTLYTLEIRHNVTGDTFHVDVWDGTQFNTRTDALGNNLNAAATTTWTYIMTTAELNGGSPKIRFRDATPTGATQGILNVDYERIVRTG